MRISDWSSDVCSSDLSAGRLVSPHNKVREESRRMSSGTNKVALVTGAARGLGLAAATKFLADGWQVAMLDILGDTVRAVAQDLGQPDAVLAIEADVSDPAAVQAAVRSEEHTSELQSLKRNSYAV